MVSHDHLRYATCLNRQTEEGDPQKIRASRTGRHGIETENKFNSARDADL